jgi:hypothetical protein
MEISILKQNTQCNAQTKPIISHLQKNDDIGRMIQTSMDHLQFKAGTSWRVLSQPGNKVRQDVRQRMLRYTQVGFPGQNWLSPPLGTNIINAPSKDWWQLYCEWHCQSPWDRVDQSCAHSNHLHVSYGLTMKDDISNNNGNALCERANKVTDNPCQLAFCFPHQEQPRTANVNAKWKQVIRLCAPCTSWFPILGQDPTVTLA